MESTGHPASVAHNLLTRISLGLSASNNEHLERIRLCRKVCAVRGRAEPGRREIKDVGVHTDAHCTRAPFAIGAIGIISNVPGNVSTMIGTLASPVLARAPSPTSRDTLSGADFRTTRAHASNYVYLRKCRAVWPSHFNMIGCLKCHGGRHITFPSASNRFMLAIGLDAPHDAWK